MSLPTPTDLATYAGERKTSYSVVEVKDDTNVVVNRFVLATVELREDLIQVIFHPEVGKPFNTVVPPAGILGIHAALIAEHSLSIS